MFVVSTYISISIMSLNLIKGTISYKSWCLLWRSWAHEIAAIGLMFSYTLLLQTLGFLKHNHESRPFPTHLVKHLGQHVLVQDGDVFSGVWNDGRRQRVQDGQFPSNQAVLL